LFIFLGVSFFLVEDIGVGLYFGFFFYLVAIFSMSYLVSGKWVVFLNLFILLVGINILYNKIVAVESSPAILRLAKIGLINIHIVLIGLSIVITLTRSITSKFMEKILFSKERQKKFNNLLSEIILNVEKTSLQIDELTSQMELISMKVKDSSAIQAASLEEISATIEELTNSVDETAHIAKEANDSVDLSIQMIESNEQNFRQTTEEILRTREESYKIEEISGKTEILAINASIEISRSTNQGFSNIAHEIRKLAEITLKTATDIFQLSDQAFGYSENSGTNLIQIKQVVSYLDTQISAIYMGVLEQKTAFESISRGIIEISESSQLNAAVSEKLTESLSELKRNSNELKSLFN
jgi:methyl-accepting chemotaxis protein